MPQNETTKLWLWKNGDHYLAFDSPCPTYDGGDPMTLGEPAGIAILTPSTPGWSAGDSAETPQQWRNQLLRELAAIVHAMAPSDGQKRIERIMRNLDAADRGEHSRER